MPQLLYNHETSITLNNQHSLNCKTLISMMMKFLFFFSGLFIHTERQGKEKRLQVHKKLDRHTKNNTQSKKIAKRKGPRLSDHRFSSSSSSAAVEGGRHDRSLEQQQRRRLLLLLPRLVAAAVRARRRRLLLLSLPRRGRPRFLAERASGAEQPGEHVGEQPRARRDERGETRARRGRAFALCALCRRRRVATPSPSPAAAAAAAAALDPQPPPHSVPQPARGDERRRRQAHGHPEDDVVDLGQPQALDNGRAGDPAAPVGERGAGLGPRYGERDPEQDPGHEDEERKEGQGGEPGRADAARGQEAAVGVAVFFFRGRFFFFLGG